MVLSGTTRMHGPALAAGASVLLEHTCRAHFTSEGVFRVALCSTLGEVVGPPQRIVVVADD